MAENKSISSGGCAAGGNNGSIGNENGGISMANVMAAENLAASVSAIWRNLAAISACTACIGGAAMNLKMT